MNIRMSNDIIYKKSNTVVSRSLKPEALVIPIKAGSANLNEVYLLNEIAARMWELIDGYRSTSQLIDIITQEYDVTTEEASADFEELASHLEHLAVLQKVTP